MKTRVSICFCLTMLVASANAHAVLIQISASEDPTVAVGQFAGFTVVFDDVSGDGLLQYNEIVSFTGIREISTGQIFTTLLGVPEIAGVSTQSGEPFTLLLSGDWWWVPVPGGIAARGIRAFRWTYVTNVLGNPPPQPVPEPSTLALLGLGLFGIAAIRRRRGSA